MRQRKVKHEAERLSALSDYMITDPMEQKGRWEELAQKHMSEQPDYKGEIYLELGCGRGKYLADLAAMHPERFYLGAEGRSSVILRAMEQIHERKTPNVLFIPTFINDMDDFFIVGELSGIYLNFSDPWPKFRHAKRRLTHRSYLMGYRRALRPGSLIEMKTDNVDLFSFTLEESHEVGLEILEYTYDLHKTDLPARLITTQYEHRFQLLGKPICYCKLRT
jgi:tRNA (guanine-N7-)-methyltransferase